jgi:3-oxoacyl-[acyl-carrier protein] reductase
MTAASGTAPRHVVVSGGSRGLGRSLVAGLLEAGYRVSTFSRSATAFTDGLATSDRFLFTTADLADAESTWAFLNYAESAFGAPYGLVNCAAVGVDGVLATTPDQAIEKALAVNVTGTLRLTKLVVRRMMLARTGGVILNISSISAVRGYKGLSAYAFGKGGMDAMTRSLARELGELGIRVNSIAPGFLETDMTHGLDQQQREQILRRTPLQRLGRAEDVLGPVLFLLSDQASFITGQILVVDGGSTV